MNPLIVPPPRDPNEERLDHLLWSEHEKIAAHYERRRRWWVRAWRRLAWWFLGRGLRRVGRKLPRATLSAVAMTIDDLTMREEYVLFVNRLQFPLVETAPRACVCTDVAIALSQRRYVTDYDVWESLRVLAKDRPLLPRITVPPGTPCIGNPLERHTPERRARVVEVCEDRQAHLPRA